MKMLEAMATLKEEYTPLQILLTDYEIQRIVYQSILDAHDKTDNFCLQIAKDYGINGLNKTVDFMAGLQKHIWG